VILSVIQLLLKHHLLRFLVIKSNITDITDIDVQEKSARGSPMGICRWMVHHFGRQDFFTRGIQQTDAELNPFHD
jgi:hypothetical protein